MSTIWIFRGTCPIWGDLLVKMKTIKQLFASSCDRLDFVLYDLDPYPYSHTAITADVEEKRWPIKLIIYPVVVTSAVTNCSGGAASQSPVQLSSARRRSVNIRRAGDEPQLEADKRGASFSCSRDGAPGLQHTDFGFGFVQCLVDEFTRLWI